MDGGVRVAGSALLLVAGVGGVAPAIAGPGAPDDSAAPAFAVTAFGGDQSRIYLLNVDGSGRRRLRTGVPFRLDNSNGPSWSPDGRTIAFAAATGEEDPPSIRVINADGTGERRLTAKSVFASTPSFSPDGLSIVFSRNTEPTRLFGNASIVTMRADGSSQKKLTHGAFDDGPSWSPDGRRIAFSRLLVRRDHLKFAVYMMNSDGTGQRRLAGDATNPAWSPDGRRIAFASIRARTGRRCVEGNCFSSDIDVMNADGTGRERVTRNSALDVAPVWSPDGAQIGFASNRSYQRHLESGFEVYTVDSNGGCVRRITNTAAPTVGVAWRPGSGTVPASSCSGALPAARTALVETDLSQAKTFAQVRLFYLGLVHRGLLLTEASADEGDTEFTFSYNDCGRIVPRSCRDSIELQVDRTCATSPLFFEPEIAMERRLPAMRTRRGALVMRLGPRFIEVYTGAVAISLDGDPRDMTRAIDALRPFNGRATRMLQPPVLSRQVAGTLRRTSDLYRRVRSIAAVQRRLGISRTVVRFRLKLAHLMEQFGPLRSTRC